jgi:hypothetical protein
MRQMYLMARHHTFPTCSKEFDITLSYCELLYHTMKVSKTLTRSRRK